MSKPIPDDGRSTAQVAGRSLHDTANAFPQSVLGPGGENPVAPDGPSGHRRTENAEVGTNPSGPDKGKGKAALGFVLDIEEGQVFTMKELAHQLSKCQKRQPKSHPTYIQPNGIPPSELGLPYTVVAGIVRKQLEANDLPPSRRAMLKENSDPKQGPGYISLDQLYEIRECISGKGRGIFAKLNIKKGQLIISEQPSITLYFHNQVINWVEDVTAIEDEATGIASLASQKTVYAPNGIMSAETEIDTRTPRLSRGPKSNSRRFIAKASQASSAKAVRQYNHDDEEEETVTVAELNPDGATGSGPNTMNTAENASPSSLDEDTNYLTDDNTRTQVRKRLLADFKEICKSYPAEADNWKRQHVDHEYRYGGDWLMRLWQRFSREIPVPGCLNPELMKPKLATVEAATPSHCRSLFLEISSVNHCCFSNAELRFWYDSAGSCHADLYATVDICRNDEISLYYDEEDRKKRLGMSEMTSNVENVFGFPCGCEPCLGGYKDRATWDARD
ncbi:hypothetical protein IFR05_006450 [Cadophora sp. M221]|nr:hypothetical protein IFR05_006450 [Cadophora sp. M221]